MLEKHPNETMNEDMLDSLKAMGIASYAEATPAQIHAACDMARTLNYRRYVEPLEQIADALGREDAMSIAEALLTGLEAQAGSVDRLAEATQNIAAMIDLHGGGG